MLKGRTLTRLGAILTFIIALISSTILVSQVLNNDKYVKAGIATLKFNFTDIHLSYSPLMRHSTAPKDIIQPFKNEAQSAGDTGFAAYPTAINKAQNTTSAALVMPNIGAPKDIIPRNCSLGTRQFCLGYRDRTECNSLPLNLPNILSEAIATSDSDQVKILQLLPATLVKVTTANIQDCLILGILLILVISVIACVAKCLLSLSIHIMMAVTVVAGLICCVPFIIPTVILYVAQSKVESLSSSVEVQKGDASKCCLGILCCGIVMTVLATLQLMIA